MNITQAKALSWTAAVLLTLGLTAYVVLFLRKVEALNVVPSAAQIQAVLAKGAPVESNDDGGVDYFKVRRLFHGTCEACKGDPKCHHLNWTGRVEAPPAEVVETQAAPVEAPRVAIRDLVRILMLRVDLAEPTNSDVFLRYKQGAGVNTPAGVPGFLLRVDDHLAAPHDKVRVTAITADGVTFTYEGEGGESETLKPDELPTKSGIVVVGPDGNVHVRDRLIPTGDAPKFRPGETQRLGENTWVIGDKDLAEFNERYQEILGKEVRTVRHQDPATGKYDGVEIKEVANGSIAERHGAQPGDVIKSINGSPVTSVQEAITFVKNNAGKYTVWKLIVENKGKSRTVIYESP